MPQWRKSVRKLSPAALQQVPNSELCKYQDEVMCYRVHLLHKDETA